MDTPREDDREQDRTVLTEEYRRMIAWVEALPQNQSGTDKSWVWQAIKQAQEHFENAKRV